MTEAADLLQHLNRQSRDRFQERQSILSFG